MGNTVELQNIHVILGWNLLYDKKKLNFIISLTHSCHDNLHLNFHPVFPFSSSVKSFLRNRHATLYPLSVLDEMQLP